VIGSFRVFQTLRIRAVLPAELAAVPDHYLRHAVVIVNYSRSAYMYPHAREFPNVLSIFIPHHEREFLFWKG
jgi:hypothetical protein